MSEPETTPKEPGKKRGRKVAGWSAAVAIAVAPAVGAYLKARAEAMGAADAGYAALVSAEQESRAKIVALEGRLMHVEDLLIALTKASLERPRSGRGIGGTGAVTPSPGTGGAAVPPMPSPQEQVLKVLSARSATPVLKFKPLPQSLEAAVEVQQTASQADVKFVQPPAAKAAH